MTQYSLFSGSGPSTGTTYATGDLVEGVAFGVTEGGLWLYGYRIWILPTTETLTGFEFALYQITGTDVGTLVPGSEVTSGTLVAGEWNVVNLTTPLLLSPAFNPPAADDLALTYGAAYMACVGNSGDWGAFPETKSQFGTGEPDSGGITNGPLFAFSSVSGTEPVGSVGQWAPQMAYSTSIGVPSSGMPTQNDTDANLWLDVLVSTVAPSGATYQLLPNMPVFNVPGVGPQTGNYTLGTEFTLSEACTPDYYWHYSAPGCTALPTECVIWNKTTETQVAGTLITSPTWSGAAGSGWISCPYVGPQLPAGDYIASDYGTGEWFLAQTEFWSTAFPSGITAGPVSFVASWYNLGVGLTYPATPTSGGSYEYDGVDMQFTPAPAPASSPAGGVPFLLYLLDEL